MQQRRCQQMGMLLKEICVTTIGIDSATGGIVLCENANRFGLSDVPPPVRKPQIILEKTLNGLDLHWESVATPIEVCIAFGDGLNDFDVSPEP